MVAFSQLISHRFRGFSDRESTLDGLTAALDFGVQQIEFDIRLSACGTPLMTHDEAARDRYGRLIPICMIMARDRAALGGDFAHMPLAEEVFDVIAQHPNQSCNLLIDVKDGGFEGMLYALCAAYGLRERALWVSWLPEVLYALNEIDPKARLCLSHWCQHPDDASRSIHRVFVADNGQVARPERRVVHGERSGWFINGPLRGTLRDIVDWVCVPAGQIDGDLVEDYHRDNIQVSAFSYLTENAINSARDEFGHDAFFCDAKTPFESIQRR